MEIMEDKQFIEFFRQMIREEVTTKETGPRLLSTAAVAEKLDVSVDYLTKEIMHLESFPKPVRFKNRGFLKFYEHEIDEFILGLRKEA